MKHAWRYWLGMGMLALAAHCGFAGISGAPFMIYPLAESLRRPPQNYEVAGASDGTNWLATWTTDAPSGIMAMRLGANGRLLDAQAWLVTPNTLAGSAARRTPAAAWHNGGWLFTWHEGQGSSARVMSRRMHANGQPLDWSAFAITNTSTTLSRPALSPNPSGYLLVWQTNSSRRIAACRLDATGRPQGATIPLATNGTINSSPAVAWGAFSGGPQSHLVVWEQGYDIYGARISAAGALLDATPLAICTNPSVQYEPAVAAGPGLNGQEGWWVLFTDDRNGHADIYGAFVNQAGGVAYAGAGTALVAQAGAQTLPAIAYDGGRYAINWYCSDYPQWAGFSSMNASGRVSDAAGSLRITNSILSSAMVPGPVGQTLALRAYVENAQAACVCRSAEAFSITTDQVVSIGASFQTYPAGGYDGTNFWAIWKRGAISEQGSDDIFAARFSPAGRPLEPAALAVCVASNRQSLPVLACNTGLILAAWSDARVASMVQVWGQFLNPNGTLAGSNFPISAASDDSAYAAAASDGSHFLVAWEYGTDQIASRFVRADGTLSAIHTYGNDGDTPAVAFGSNVYLVVWEEGSRVLARRYRVDETLLDASITLQSGSTVYDPQVAYNPAANRFLVAWEVYPDLMGSIVDPGTGAISPTPILLTPGDGAKLDPKIMFDGQTWVVAWADSSVANNSYATRIANDGTVLDANGIRLLSRNSRICGSASSGGAHPDSYWLAHGIFYDLDGVAYNSYRVFALPWQPGPQTTNAPAINFITSRPDGSWRMQCQESAPPGTGYVVEAAAQVTHTAWNSVAGPFITAPNGVFIEILFTNHPATAGCFRVKSQR